MGRDGFLDDVVRISACSGEQPLTFFSVAATVIPVLFVAAGYQAKVLTEPSSPCAFLTATATTGLMAAGEVLALYVLASEHPTKGAQVGVF